MNGTALHFIHASDEWYLKAERDFPEEERYDGYIQLENGVGMMRLLYDEFTEALAQAEPSEEEAETFCGNRSPCISHDLHAGRNAA